MRQIMLLRPAGMHLAQPSNQRAVELEAGRAAWMQRRMRSRDTLEPPCAVAQQVLDIFFTS